MAKEEDQIEAMRRHLELEKKAKKILGLSDQTKAYDKTTINQAWRTLSAKWHPDRHQGSKEAHRRFLVISCAYRYLMTGEECQDMNIDQLADQEKAAGEYRLDNDWGYFAWWQENFNDS